MPREEAIIPDEQGLPPPPLPSSTFSIFWNLFLVGFGLFLLFVVVVIIFLFMIRRKFEQQQKSATSTTTTAGNNNNKNTTTTKITSRSQSQSSSSKTSSTQATARTQPPAPPPRGGELFVEIISLNNVPSTTPTTKDPPLHVSIRACGQTVKIPAGEPSSSSSQPTSCSYQFTTSTSNNTDSQQQTCCSYLFTANNNNNNNIVRIPSKTLSYLWDTSFLVEVGDENNALFKGTYTTKDLGINQLNHVVIEFVQDDNNQKNAPPPTIELIAQLSSCDYRTEIRWLFRAGKIWYKIVDTMERFNLLRRLLPSFSSRKSNDDDEDASTKKTLFSKTIMIPAVLVTCLVLPFLVFGLMVIVPFALPILIPIVGVVAGTISAFVVFVSITTSHGRQYVMEPLYDHMCTTKFGQSLLFPIGPRPTNPIDALEILVPTNKWLRLVLSLAIDFIGCSSYVIPGAGEASDIVWAPIQTMLIIAMYNETSPHLKYISFAEEILPFTDIIPSATLGWFIQYYYCNGGGQQTLAAASASQDDVIPDHDLKLKEN